MTQNKQRLADLEVCRQRVLSMQALQRRVETLNALVTASTDAKTTDTTNSAAAVADMKSEHDKRMAAMLAQLEEKEADLAGTQAQHHQLHKDCSVSCVVRCHISSSCTDKDVGALLHC